MVRKIIENPRILLYIALALAFLRLGARADALPVPHRDNAIPRLQVCIIPQPSQDEPESDPSDPVAGTIA